MGAREDSFEIENTAALFNLMKEASSPERVGKVE
jgi:hypothetical protein